MSHPLFLHVFPHPLFNGRCRRNVWLLLNVPFGKHPLVGGGGYCSCVLGPTARVNFIDDLGENARPFIWFHFLQRHYKLIDDLL